MRLAGYTGQKTALFALIAAVRPKDQTPLVRFEGLPGEFSQHDFGQVDVEYVDGATQRIRFFASRLKYALDGPSCRTTHLNLDRAIPQDGPGATVSGKLVPEFPEPTRSDVKPFRSTCRPTRLLSTCHRSWQASRCIEDRTCRGQFGKRSYKRRQSAPALVPSGRERAAHDRVLRGMDLALQACRNCNHRTVGIAVTAYSHREIL